MKKIRRWLRNWLRCRTKRCDYFESYLAYGPAELTHEGYHAAIRRSEEHFKNCTYNGPGLCSICTNWEKRLRA